MERRNGVSSPCASVKIIEILTISPTCDFLCITRTFWTDAVVILISLAITIIIMIITDVINAIGTILVQATMTDMNEEEEVSGQICLG